MSTTLLVAINSRVDNVQRSRKPLCLIIMRPHARLYAERDNTSDRPPTLCPNGWTCRGNSLTVWQHNHSSLLRTNGRYVILPRLALNTSGRLDVKHDDVINMPRSSSVDGARARSTHFTTQRRRFRPATVVERHGWHG